MADVVPGGGQTQEEHEIKGGTEPLVDELLFVIRVSGGRFFCSGALIAPQWIITAGHCMADKNDRLDVSASQIRIELGWRSYGTPYYVSTRSVKQVVLHPDYSSNGGYAPFVNDVALIQLEGPLPEIPSLRPVLKPVRFLNRQEEARYAPSGTKATIAGWGGRRSRAQGRTDDVPGNRLPRGF